LECTILAVLIELTRAGVDNGCLRTEAGGGDCWWSVVEAAAAVNPRDRRAEGKRRSVEENSLKVVVGKGGEGLKM
jgi:hypothetical protein